MKLHPPFLFTNIVEGVFTSAYPTLPTFSFLQKLNLRTIISLIPEEPTYDLSKFCSEEGINLIWEETPPWRENVVLTPAVLNKCINLILTPSTSPILIHCIDGGHTSGLVIRALRKLQAWDNDSSWAEFVRLSRDLDEVSQDERDFIDNWKGEALILPEAVPSWLFDVTSYSSHPYLELKFPKAKVDKRQVFNEVLQRLRDPNGLSIINDEVLVSHGLEALALEGATALPE